MKKVKAKAVRINRFVLVAVSSIILASFILLTGCQKQAVKTEAPPPPAAEVKQPEPAPAPKEPEKIPEQKVETVASREVETPHEKVKEGMFADILFDYDKYEVRETYKAELKELSEWLTKNSGATLSIEGHCDDRGTNEYNLALGDRRAKAVRDYLLSLGVPSSRIEIISYGEERPLCADQTEECWAKNRRAHFAIMTTAGK